MKNSHDPLTKSLGDILIFHYYCLQDFSKH